MVLPPQQLVQEVDQLRIENRVLTLRVKALEKELYGSRSDRRRAEDPNQARLEGIEEQAAWDEAHLAQQGTPAGVKPQRKENSGKKKGPRPINPDLPRIEESVPDPQLKDLICPVTGKPMRAAFTGSVEVLARKPAEYYVRRLIRTVFTGASEVAPVYSPWPGSVLPKSRIDVSVIANVLTSRFADHQPYHRQCAQLRRHGVELAPNTLCSLVGQAHRKLEPIWRQVLLEVLASGYIQMDPTPIPLMSEHKKGSTKEACMWTYRALDGPVCFEFSENKSGQTPAKTLQKYTGILQTDGANNFGGVPARADVIHMNCWAHARRYFINAEEANEAKASVYLNDINRIFRIERRARHFKLRPDNLLKLRQHHSLPLLDALFARARACVFDERMRKTPLPKAVRYTLTRERELRACFEHAPSRIDNNLAENALRPLKPGARNWLFIGHANAGPRAAVMFTLVENCRIAELTPHAWALSKNA